MSNNKRNDQRSSKIQILHDSTGSPWIFRSLMPQLCSFTEVNTLNCSIHVARVAWRDIILEIFRAPELEGFKNVHEERVIASIALVENAFELFMLIE